MPLDHYVTLGRSGLRTLAVAMSEHDQVSFTRALGLSQLPRFLSPFGRGNSGG